MSYSRGPWKKVIRKDGSRSIVAANGRGVCQIVDWKQSESPEDNDPLLEAAPELLNALRWSVNHSDECLGDYPHLLEFAGALIAKAEGGNV